jgi:hypothetical protein
LADQKEKINEPTGKSDEKLENRDCYGFLNFTDQKE